MNIFKKIKFLLPWISSFFIARLASAQDDKVWDSINKSFNPFRKIYGGNPQDPRVIAANLISTLMRLLGIIFIIMIIYAGFMWMTAAGNEDRVRLAKQTLTRGTIGVGIIILAFALARFVLVAFGCATGPQNALCLFLTNV